MFPAKPYFCALTLFLAALLTLPSCAAFDMFKDEPVPSEAVETTTDGETGHEGMNTGDQATEIESLEEKVVLLEDKIKTLESRVAGQKKVIYTIEYSDPAQLYQKARTLLLDKKIDTAADLFTTFYEKHPDHGLADNAVYWLGECHYTRGQYQKAAETFKELVKTYPKAEKVPDALLKTGYAYISLDDINRADHYLKQVIKKHPFSPAAEKAQAKLKEFQ